MRRHKCPGRDMRHWSPEDIYDVECPQCGTAIEFFKDDRARKCPHCRHEVHNPRLDLGCVRWCQSADECLGRPERKPGKE
jgi:NADH pyrophosphatase NudC (nudix superfamily)